MHAKQTLHPGSKVNQDASDHAVLLLNQGMPDAPTAAVLRPWLAEFLGDARVLDMRPRWGWWLLLHGLIALALADLDTDYSHDWRP